MKKIVTSVALASVLFSGVAFAEESGTFVGIDLGYGQKKSGDWDGTGYIYGLSVGYKYFQDANLGYRGYLAINNAKYTSGDTGPKGAQLENLTYGLNADVLYNFSQSGDLEYGAFGGLSLDYANNTAKNKRSPDVKANGLDVGVNLGARVVYANVHGIELWTRWGFTGPKFDGSDEQVKSPYKVGLRYTFSF